MGNHPFGQDDIGRDYFALVMNGARRSLMIMFVIGAVSGFIGVVVGSLAGFYGKMVDATLMRLVDFIQTVPTIIIAAVIGKAAGRVGPLFLALFLGILGWTGLARLVRAQFLSLREMEFVDAARVAGASNLRIAFQAHPAKRSWSDHRFHYFDYGWCDSYRDRAFVPRLWCGCT